MFGCHNSNLLSQAPEGLSYLPLLIVGLYRSLILSYSHPLQKHMIFVIVQRKSVEARK
jgi:hypothetical protein